MKIRFGVAAAIVALCVLASASQASALPFVVNNIGDGSDVTAGDNLCDAGAGQCTLRAAIAEANANPPMDTITFAAGLSGPIELGSSLSVTQPISITGNGSGTSPIDTVIDGNDAFRLLSIAVPGSATIALENLRFTDGGLIAGGSGAGIRTTSNTTLTGVVLASNQITGSSSGDGGGIGLEAAATLTLDHTTVDGNKIDVSGASSSALGAGVSAIGASTLVIRDSTVSQNNIVNSPSTALPAHGGGVFANSEIDIERSNISGNSAGPAGVGGGFGDGGNGQPKSITDSTFSGNAAGTGGGGGAYFENSATITGSTFAANTDTVPGGGGYDLRANFPLTVTVKDTILASTASQNDCVGTGGALIVSAAPGNNIDAGASCNFGTANGNRQNTNPLLGPLVSNGGPTMTHALLAGSPAIDGATADCGGLATDQRGVSRPQPAGGVCDVGAFELEQEPAQPPGGNGGATTQTPAAPVTPKKCKKSKKHKRAVVAKKCKKRK